MKDKKILFMGGKYVGYNCLKFLVEGGFKVMGCFVDPNDRDDKISKSVKKLCLDNKIPVFIYKDVNAKESENTIKKLSADIIVVIYYDQILKPNIINLPPLGCLNLHLALSQVHRGCYPTTWSLIRGDKYTGATLHYITPRIDGGPVVGQKKLKIDDEWTGKDLYYKLSDVGIDLFKKKFPILNKVKPYAIDISKSVYYKREFPSHEINLDKKTYNRIRALIFDPFPKPYIKIGKRKFEITELK